MCYENFCSCRARAIGVASGDGLLFFAFSRFSWFAHENLAEEDRIDCLSCCSSCAVTSCGGYEEPQNDTTNNHTPLGSGR